LKKTLVPAVLASAMTLSSAIFALGAEALTPRGQGLPDTTGTTPSVLSDDDFMPLSYEQVAALIDSMERVSTKGYLRTLTGRKVRWQGWIYRVNRDYSPVNREYEGYSVYVDMRRDSGAAAQSDPWEVELKVPKGSPLNVHALGENQPVLFSGTIEIARFLATSEHVKITLQDVTASIVEVSGGEPHETRGTPYRVLFATPVRSEPTEDSREISRLGSGTEVSVIAVHGDWLELHRRYDLPPGFINKTAAEPVTSR